MLNKNSLQTFLAIAPVIMFVLLFAGYFVFIFSFLFQIETLENSGQDAPPMAFFAGFGVFFVLIMLTVLLSLFSLIYYIIHAAKNPNLEENNMRIVWILILLFISGIGQLIYWYVEIKTKNPRPVIPD